MKSLVCLIAVLIPFIPCHADILTLNPDGSAQYTNLSQALQQAQPGDTLRLQPGLYRGNQNSNLYFYTGSITIESEQGPQTCTIDCESNGRFMYASGGQDSLITLKGLTIVNASGGSGNIYVGRGSLTLDNCVVRDCVSTSSGGVIYSSGGDQIILIRSQFLNNACRSEGGVLSAWNTATYIDHCVFSGNTTEGEGGVLFVYCYDEGCTLTVSNSTFSSNAAEDQGAVLAGYLNQDITFQNCIFADNQNMVMSLYRYNENINITQNNCLYSANTGGLFYDWRQGTTYSTVSSLNAVAGSSGNISGQPRFAADADFHLLGNSAAIDTGLTTSDDTDLDGLPRQIDGDRNGSVIQDIGPYEYDPNHPLIVAIQTHLVFIRDVNAPNPSDQILSFLNTTSSPLHWSLGSDVSWLEVSRHSGTLINEKASVTVSVASDGMSRGIYTGTLTLTDPNAVNNPVQVLVTLKIRGTLSVPDEFATIGEAVNEAMPHEIIEVHGGTYTNGVILDKPVTLIGHQDPNIVTRSIGIQIQADNCLIQGFNLSGSNYGLYVSGSDNTLRNMTIAGGGTGIYMTKASNNTLDQIAISNCSTYGLNIQNSAQNTLINVTILNCTRGFTLTGDTPDDYQQTIDQTNTVDGNPIFYLVGISDRVITSSLATPACVYLVDCTDVVLVNLSFRGNGCGVCLVNSSNNTLRSVQVSDCDAGFWLLESPSNALLKNTITESNYGIRLVRSAKTTLKNNTLIDNTAGFSMVAENDHFDQTIDTTNLVNGLPIYYLVGQTGVTLDETKPAACLYAVNCSSLTITGQTMKDNTYGIALINCTNTVIQDVTCRDNEQSNLFMSDCTGVTISRCLFTNSQYGLDMTECTKVDISNCTLGYNLAGMQSNNTGYILVNSLIHHNTQYGGVRHMGSSTQKGIIQGCTLINNSDGSSSYSGNGGAITGSPEYLTILDSILWNNAPGTIPEPDYYNYNISYCCLQDTLEGTGNFTDDPRLTSDGHLTLESPCIDAATPGRRIVAGLDIDGERRRSGNNVDVGADEYIDTDTDGLPDWFERDLDPNGLAMNPDDDLDGDGYTNLEEYIRFSGSALVPSGSYYVDPIHGDDLNPGNEPNVPMKTLQKVFEAVGPGERVILKPGVYSAGSLVPQTHNLLIESMDPEDPSIVASTVIGSPVELSGQSSNIEFNGLTFSSQLEQATVNCNNGNALFRGCRFVDNQYVPLMAYNAILTVKQCEFSRNTGLVGAAFTQNSDLTMENCLITDNFSSGYSGAITTVSETGKARVTLIHCTIANNSSHLADSILADYYAMDYVPAILLYGAELVVTNSIIWDIHPAIFELTEENVPVSSTAWVTYSNLSDTADTLDPNWLGLGNISVNPGFAQPGYQPDGSSHTYVIGDYHLLSEAGRWDPTQGTWVQDIMASQSIGAANPAWIARDPNWIGIRLNLGAYGNTTQTSQAPENWTLVSDLTNDGIVDALDETAFTQLQSSVRAKAAFLNANPADLDQDGDVDTEDLQILQGQMGQSTTWHVQGLLNDQWSAPPALFQPATSGSTGSTAGGSTSTGATAGGGR